MMLKIGEAHKGNRHGTIRQDQRAYRMPNKKQHLNETPPYIFRDISTVYS